jgi:hypothetical protein
MKTYQFKSIIDENGLIVLPDEIKRLKNHRIKLIVTDLDSDRECTNTIDFLNSVTDKYLNIEENELDITEIYNQREKTDDRRIMFD